MPSGQDQRRHPRYALAERAAILLGPATYVFSETLDISRGGACLRHPNRFVVQAGEQLNLASAHIGSQRAARVVSVSSRGLHCAFDSDPDPVDSETSAAL
ncbi:MAG TPA: PilZ domain-containing protein [Candidatus Sulfotelmatobacter sp.]|nr:PilZ domain-containing protein [Candidatus Sulfotelmatobacter sp.]